MKRFFFFACVSLITAYAASQEQNFTLITSYGFGYEDRGIAGRYLGAYSGIQSEFGRYILSLNIALNLAVPFGESSQNIFRSAAARMSYIPFRIETIRIHTLVYAERFSASRSSLFSFLQTASWETEFTDFRLGINIRVFSMDGNDAGPLFSNIEKHFSFHMGGRINLSKRLGLKLAIGNFDEYTAGGTATISYRALLEWSLRETTLIAEYIHKPAGSIALASAPMGCTARFLLRHRIRFWNET